MLNRAQWEVLAITGRGRVLDIDEIQETDCVQICIACDDEEIFCVHQCADNGMNATQHVRHVTIGARQVGNREQRTLQGFGTLQLLMRMLQPEPLQRAAQMLTSKLQRLYHSFQKVLRVLPRQQAQQQQRGLGLLAEANGHTVPIEVPVRLV